MVKLHNYAVFVYSDINYAIWPMFSEKSKQNTLRCTPARVGAHNRIDMFEAPVYFNLPLNPIILTNLRRAQWPRKLDSFTKWRWAAIPKTLTPAAKLQPLGGCSHTCSHRSRQCTNSTSSPHHNATTTIEGKCVWAKSLLKTPDSTTGKLQESHSK